MLPPIVRIGYSDSKYGDNVTDPKYWKVGEDALEFLDEVFSFTGKTN